MIKWTSLKSRRDFNYVISRGRLVKSECFIIYCLKKNESEKGIRVGICVGKSLGGAVKRNRLKRQIREAIKRIEFRITGIDVVIIARKKIIGFEFRDIRKAAEKALSRARLV